MYNVKVMPGMFLTMQLPGIRFDSSMTANISSHNSTDIPKSKRHNRAIVKWLLYYTHAN